MFFYPIALLIAGFSIYISTVHLQQSLVDYWDFVGFAMVMGGTAAVALITFPWDSYRDIVAAAKRLFLNRQGDGGTLARECLGFVTRQVSGGAGGEVGVDGLAGSVLRDGDELIALGFSRERVREVLEERIFQAGERAQRVANAFRSLAKYPPAFGLVGTVLGLVSVMRAVSEGSSAAETGMRMSVALVATLYGLLVANLLVNPAGESILKDSVIERKRGELALQAVMLAMERPSLLEAQEVLNSFVPARDRVSVLGGGAVSSAGGGAAA
jgi:chemotaxis protein MotA